MKQETPIEEYLRIHHQEGQLAFTSFTKATARLYTYEGKTVMDILIKTDETHKSDEPESWDDFIQLAILECLRYPISVAQFEDLTSLVLEIPDEFEYSEIYDSHVTMYLGFCIAINHNNIRFKKIGSDYYVFWDCIGNDIMYYDQRAKPNKVELVAKITLKNEVV